MFQIRYFYFGKLASWIAAILLWSHASKGSVVAGVLMQRCMAGGNIDANLEYQIPM